MSQSYVLILLVLLWAVVTLIRYRTLARQKLPLPPSITPEPFIGHLRSIPSTDEPRVYRDWGLELNSA